MAQTSNTEAEALNEEGKALFKEKRYLEAYKRFQRATEISPEARYFFNVCFSLHFLERYNEAIEACERVQSSGADAKLQEKTNSILEQLYAQVGTKDAPATNQTGTAQPTTKPANEPAYQPPDQGIALPGGEERGYAWSLGASLGPTGAQGIGMGYADMGVHVEAFADLMLNRDAQIGIQGYLGATTLSSDVFLDDLTIVDVGGAAYKHFSLTDSIDWTPLLGLQAVFFQPDGTLAETLVALGLRAQVSFDWALGKTNSHVISLAPMLTVISPASNSSNLTAADYGLDEPGATFEVALAYRYRFSSVFGPGSLFTLE